MLSRRAPGFDWESRLPQFPVRLSHLAVGNLDPVRARPPAPWADDEISEFKTLVASGALLEVSPTAPESKTMVEGRLFYVDQTPHPSPPPQTPPPNPPAPTPPSPPQRTNPPPRTVTKRDHVPRKLRLIYDCRRLNSLLQEPPPFALDDIYGIPAYLTARRARLLGKVDLRSAYFHVPVHPDDQRLLGCTGPDGRRYKWAALPMGLAHAPHLFQALTSCFRDAWRAAGHTVSVYLDDFLVGGEDAAQYASALEAIVDDLLEAGWQVREAKCVIVPDHATTYLGIEVNAAAHTLRLPSAKAQFLVDQARAWTTASSVPLNELQRWLGRASYARTVCPRLGYFLVHLFRALPASERSSDMLSDQPPPPHRHHRSTSTTPVPLPPAAREELAWWATAHDRLVRPMPWRSVCTMRVWTRRSASLPPRPLAGTAASDASETGVAGSFISDGDWATERRLVLKDGLPAWAIGASSCTREIVGAALTIDALPPTVRRGQTIRFVMDAQASVATAVSGGACVGTVRAARLLDTVIEARGLDVLFEWAPRDHLQLEDTGSRDTHASNARVHTTDLTRLTLRMGTPTIDAFASHTTRVCRVYGSRWGGAESLGDGIAVLSRATAADRIWAFPPFALARPALAAAISACATVGASCVMILPDRPATRSLATSTGWSCAPGPRSLLYPDQKIRAPAEPLIVVSSPNLTTPPPSIRSTPPQLR